MILLVNPRPDPHHQRSCPEQALRNGRYPLAYREVDVPRGGQLTSDLTSRVPCADDEYVSHRELLRLTVVRAMYLCDLGIERLPDRRDEGIVERAGRDDDLLRHELFVRRLSDVEAVASRQRGHFSVWLDRQVERRGIRPQVVRNVVLAGIGVPLGGEGQPREAVVLRWCER